MLEALRIQTVTYFLKQFFEVAVGRMMIEGDVDDAIKDSGIPERFNEWIMAVLDSEAGPQEATMPASAVMSAGYNTRMTRMAAGSRVLEANSRDVRVLVITENDFAVELHGVDNVAVVGAKVTVKDLNGNTVVTKLTEDPDVGSAVFNANEFSCDYDKEMELSVEMDASEQGYRGFYIPWLMLKRGGVYCQTLTLLTGPETQEAQSTETREAKEARALFAAEASEVKPYVYACTFNGYDILRQDKKTVISKVNDANINFELDLVHPEGKAPQAPVLHCFIEVREGRLGKMEEKTFKPTSQSTVSPTRTKYVYTNTWKRDLSPEIGKNQKPFFVLPDTGEVVNITLQPVRAKIDQPLISGQEASNPFNSVFAKGFNLAVSIPVIGGALTVSLPFDRYLPKISVDPSGYVSITFGSSILKDPADATLWKNKEAEAYDKSMKEFQHDMSLARKKQAMGTARQYYIKITEKTGQARVKLDFGYFMMFAGRKQADEEDDTILWSASGGTGAELVFSWEYTKPFSVCGVPMYFNIAFSASAGIAVEGLCFSFYTDGSMHLKNFEWSLVRGLSINVRLMLTVTFGIGIKGICSAWLSASGGLNVIIHIMTTQPTHIAVYGEFFLTVGFELFWIKYTRQLWRSPNWKIYSNYDMKGEANFDLFTAYAEEPDSGGVEMTELEPSRYPALAPDAKRILTNADGVEAGIRVVELAGETLVFFVGMSTNSEGKKRRQLQWMDMATGKVEALPRNSKVEDLEDYAFDVVSDGRCIAVSACCAKQFDDNGYPKPGDIYCYTAIVTPDYNNDMPNSDYFCRGFYINKLNPLEISYNGINNPRIEALHSDIDSYKFSFRVFGSYDAYYFVPKDRGSIGFEVASEGINAHKMMLFGDRSVKSAFGDANERVVVCSDGRNAETYTGDVHLGLFPSPGFIALSRPQGDEAGESGIELYDYEMNAATASSKIVQRRRIFTDSKRKAIALATGDIDHIEVLRTRLSDGESSARTVFYNQTETKGDRTEKRLKSIYIAPRQGGSDNFSYDVKYTDYDVSINAGDFHVVTLGSSQYLYWISTVLKEKESDPDIWRISGLYYDPGTGSMSDEITIAEFKLPNAVWKGQTWRSVPFEVMLTESGVGYITARPEDDLEKENVEAPLTLYSFPITLKPVMTMRNATLMETTVCQGELIATDFSMMNEGNMGIGSFDIEMYMMNNGEQGDKIETLHADCLCPGNSLVVLHGADGDQIAVDGEEAFYRLKDFEYASRQNEWIVTNQSKTITVKDATKVSIRDSAGNVNHVVTDVLVPGALGGYTGAIKIPSEWKGTYDLRLKLTNVSTYSNWLAAAALARIHPELFAENSGGQFEAKGTEATLADYGIEKLVYQLDEKKGKLVLQQPNNAGGSEAVPFYATEIDAPEAVDVNCDVHDIDVGHRVWVDYYGEEMLDIIINNYHTTQENIELTCAVYLDNASTPRYVSLPYDPSALSAGKTTTITVPLKTLIPDADQHREARVVITARNVAETAMFNNEFTLYLGSSGPLMIVQHPVSVTVPVGGAATFTVGVTGGTPPYAYQWQVLVDGKWQNVPGANEATLTLKNVKAAWNGRRTRCVVTDAAGAMVVSDEAVLTVIGANQQPDTGDHTHLPLYLAVALFAIAILMILCRRERD